MKAFHAFNTKDIGQLEVARNMATKQVTVETEEWNPGEDADREIIIDDYGQIQHQT